MALFQPIQQKGFTMIRVAGRLLSAVLTISLLCTSAAYADLFRLRVEDISTGIGIGVVVTDGEDGDINPLTGVITYSGAINNDFLVNVTTGVSKPVIGGVNNYAELDLNSVNVQVGRAGTLRITLEDTGYTSGPDGELSAVGAVGGTLIAAPGSTATFQSWVNPSDLVPWLGLDASSPKGLSSIGDIPVGSVAL